MRAPRYHRSSRIVLLVRVLHVVAYLSLGDTTHADIYRWDNGQLIPGTEGITPGPGVQLDHHELAYAALFQKDLTDARFDFSNLTNAALAHSTLTNANLTGAVVTGADFDEATSRGFTKDQLYSTASYKANNLQTIELPGNDLSGWDFSGQNLMNASFNDSTLANANFSRSDMRGTFDVNLTGAVTTNAILPSGKIAGLELAAGDQLLVRPYRDQGLTPIGVAVQDHMTMASGGVLHMLFDADDAIWDSTITFAAGIPVTRGGTLELSFAPDLNLSNQIGRTFDLFDWTGVNPTGAFAVASPYRWDLSNLYTTGQVTLTAIPEPSTVMLLILAAAGALINRNGGRGERCRRPDFAVPMGRFEGPRT
jgi:uncharacterized protein YjbI with pentapeptide repeats